MNEVAKMNELMIKQKTNTQTTQTQCNEDKRQQDKIMELGVGDMKKAVFTVKQKQCYHSQAVNKCYVNDDAIPKIMFFT